MGNGGHSHHWGPDGWHHFCSKVPGSGCCRAVLLTRFCNIAWTSRTEPPEWKTGQGWWFPFWRSGTREGFLQCAGEKRWAVEHGLNIRFKWNIAIFFLEHWTSPLPFVISHKVSCLGGGAPGLWQFLVHKEWDLYIYMFIMYYNFPDTSRPNHLMASVTRMWGSVYMERENTHN